MQSIPPASIACGREALGWESNIRNDIDETLGNYIKFRALCIYLFDYMHSSVDVEWRHSELDETCHLCHNICNTFPSYPLYPKEQDL